MKPSTLNIAHRFNIATVNGQMLLLSAQQLSALQMLLNIVSTPFEYQYKSLKESNQRLIKLEQTKRHIYVCFIDNYASLFSQMRMHLILPFVVLYLFHHLYSFIFIHKNIKHAQTLSLFFGYSLLNQVLYILFLYLGFQLIPVFLLSNYSFDLLYYLNIYQFSLFFRLI